LLASREGVRLRDSLALRVTCAAFGVAPRRLRRRRDSRDSSLRSEFESHCHLACSRLARLAGDARRLRRRTAAAPPPQVLSGLLALLGVRVPGLHPLACFVRNGPSDGEAPGDSLALRVMCFTVGVAPRRLRRRRSSADSSLDDIDAPLSVRVPRSDRLLPSRPRPWASQIDPLGVVSPPHPRTHACRGPHRRDRRVPHGPRDRNTRLMCSEYETEQENRKNRRENMEDGKRELKESSRHETRSRCCR